MAPNKINNVLVPVVKVSTALEMVSKVASAVRDGTKLVLNNRILSFVYGVKLESCRMCADSRHGAIFWCVKPYLVGAKAFLGLWFKQKCKEMVRLRVFAH
jgi:hypothetical protein